MKLTISVVVCLQLCAQMLADPIAEPLALPRCRDSDFIVTVDNKLELFIDGVQVSSLPNADTWPTADKVKVAASAKVIAIKGVDDGVIASGILASGAHGITNGLWRCTNAHYDGWATESFDDSHWPAATVIGSHGVSPWGTISGISHEAKWIWTSKYTNGVASDKTVYCRKRRGCYHGTGPSCITSCTGKADGDYQSCKGCGVYATCSNENLYDNRPCAPSGLVWDDNVKRCEWTTSTCTNP